MTFHTNFKPSRTARKKDEKAVKLARKTHETNEKKKVRKRDKVCRFPLCGCRKLGLAIECSHQVQHKGMGGNPAGDRSYATEMALLCNHRHQFGRISRHAGTLRGRPLTRDGYDGPVAWDVDVSVIPPHVSTAPSWMEVARETSPGHIEPLDTRQARLLTLLAEMDL